jgi:cytochrome c oxidase assembly factor CtaG
MWSNSVFYPHYAAGEAKWHVSAITDQSIAGVLMMVEGGFVTLGVLAWLFLQWAQQDTERQRLLDLAEQRGVPLSDARAARAAAAGQSGRLEERIKTEGSS